MAGPTCGLILSSRTPRYGTNSTATIHESTSAITVTAKIAKVYSPTVDFASPIGRKPAAVISVPVSMGMAVASQVKVAARTMV